VLFLGILAATALVAVGAHLLLGRSRNRRLAPWLFFVLPPLAFALKEFERALAASGGVSVPRRARHGSGRLIADEAAANLPSSTGSTRAALLSQPLR
jgi:hypothetical protein